MFSRYVSLLCPYRQIRNLIVRFLRFKFLPAKKLDFLPDARRSECTQRAEISDVKNRDDATKRVVTPCKNDVSGNRV